jgi:hypothetical protein
MKGLGRVFARELAIFLRDRVAVVFTLVVPALIFPVLAVTMGLGAGRTGRAERVRPCRVMLLGEDGAVAAAVRSDPGVRLVAVQPGMGPRDAVVGKRADLVLETLGSRRLRVTVNPLDGKSREALERVDHLVRDTLGPKVPDPSTLGVEVVSVGMGGWLARTIGVWAPGFVLSLAFVGFLAHGVASTAHEREDGTLLCLVNSKLSRTGIVAGKVLAVFTIGLTALVLDGLGGVAGAVLTAAASGRGGEGGLFAKLSPGVASLERADLMGCFGLGRVAIAGGLLVMGCLFLAALIVWIGFLTRSERQAYLAGGLCEVGLMALSGLVGSFGAGAGTKLAFLPLLGIIRVTGETIAPGPLPWARALVALGMTGLGVWGLVRLAARGIGRESTLFPQG